MILPFLVEMVRISNDSYLHEHSKFAFLVPIAVTGGIRATASVGPATGEDALRGR